MTDEFTTAAKNEAARSYSGDWDPGEEVPVDDWGLSRMERDAFRAGAEWARDHLAAQEPTGDEHYAAAQVIYEATTEDDILRWPHVSDEETARCMNLARAALEAARGEKRNRR